MLNMEVGDIRAFVAIADAGSVSAAARGLFLTQSAVTRRLQRLESAIGATLLDRRSRPFTLTRAGQAALERCRSLLLSVEELLTVGDEGQQPSGELRLGVAHALTELTLARPIDEIQRRFPRVRFRISTGWSRDLLERVRTQAIDGALLLLPQGEALPAGVTGAPVADERLHIVAAQGLRTGTLTVAELARHGWVLNPEGCAARATLRRALVGAGTDLHVGIETHSYELQLSLVARNRGLGLVPGRLLARSRSRKHVRVVRVRGLDFRSTIWSLRGRPPLALQPLLDELNSVLTQRLSPDRSRT